MRVERKMDLINTVDFIQRFGNTDLRLKGDRRRQPSFFGVFGGSNTYVATEIQLTDEFAINGDAEDSVQGPNATFVVARGATGKTALSQELSARIGAPLWNASADLTIGAYSLQMHLTSFLNQVDPHEHIQDLSNPIIVIDGVDEAQVRVSTESWGDFKKSLVEFAAMGLKFIILGRSSASGDIAREFSEAELAAQIYELRPFNLKQAHQFLDAKFASLKDKNSNIMRSVHYKNSKEVIFTAIKTQLNNSRNSYGQLAEEFLGYAPVLEAIAIRLNSTNNIAHFAQELKEDLATGERVLGLVVRSIAEREREKFLSNLPKMKQSNKSSFIFTEKEQVSAILHAMDSANAPDIPAEIAPKDHYAYEKARDKQIADHPFVVPAQSPQKSPQWASRVFEGYVYFNYSEQLTSQRQLVTVASRNPLLYTFAVAAQEYPVADEWFISAIHASMNAYFSGIESIGRKAGGPPDFFAQILNIEEGIYKYRVFAHATESDRSKGLMGNDFVELIDLPFLLEEREVLRFYGPLKNISIICPVIPVRLKPIDRAPQIGPELMVFGSQIAIENYEARLRYHPGGALASTVHLYAQEFDIFLPRLDDFDPKTQEWIQLSSPAINPKDLSYPWSIFIKELSDTSMDNLVSRSALDRFMRIVSELKTLRAQSQKTKSGPERVVWCAKVGLNKSSKNTAKILQILEDEGIIKEENGRIRYTNDAKIRPLFRTPYDVPPNSSTEFAQLDEEAKDKWLKVLVSLGEVESSNEAL